MSGTADSGGIRIVRLANFVTPASGGLRTALQELGTGYRAAGHEPVLIVPGERPSDVETAQGRVITLSGAVLPGTGGYRVLTSRRRLSALLESLAPDRLEVSDRTTLRWTGEWARRRRIPSVMVSHETADGVLRTWGVPDSAAERAADRLNKRSAWAYSRIVCTTEWAEREFVRIGARNVVRAPLGVDLVRCRPDRRREALRAKYARGADVLLLLCSRLSVEKRPAAAVDALAVLIGRGVRASLVVAGDGPLAGGLARRARERRLPVEFLGHVGDREELADLQASADICLAPGPAETFGLSALEALASGTPVVSSATSALPEILGAAGCTAADTPRAFADAVQELLARPEGARRAAARARAELFGWDRAVAAFLAAHEAPVLTGRDVLPAERSAVGPPAATGTSVVGTTVPFVPAVMPDAVSDVMPDVRPLTAESPIAASSVPAVPSVPSVPSVPFVPRLPAATPVTSAASLSAAPVRPPNGGPS
ncbi:GDP-mannose-dependent alpha-(1-6)-phosphatidylinositol dimannoside mannosyltransferase [Streptomyces camponoticapitis]|uniref:GDP-mannose-dependent alpha-(1-6)-phosphatidylinositol dimannoside mannosyltransferase n=1 Tax=Streptomyces camponoticapitis TaxID=1616125 RepID=A0ABQ2EDD2_9ACTN|nr:GDP-mannose-dependent alpha-(1-6)-phosphatidylinositol dimannoside mannosyltransferase [Streptomyces camponoticapitis]